MIKQILWFIILIIYTYCLFYKKEDFNNIKNKIIYGLKIIDKLFNKHNIYYTCAYGTLLGAVRHRDMIPWDDDADINVWLKDYNLIQSLKDEFKSYGLILETDWKLMKIYFDETRYPFIDIFINEVENGKVIRCKEPFGDKCGQLDKNNKWWWKWIDYPAEWITERKRFKFGPIEIWCPIESDKLLKYWYGENYLTFCKTPEIDHTGNKYIKSENINCGLLPEPQI